MDIPIVETGLASTALALLILREVFAFMKDRKVNGNGLKYTEIQKWHEVEKSLPSLTETIRKLTHAISTQTQTLNAVLYKIQHDVEETRRQIKDAVQDCRSK